MLFATIWGIINICLLGGLVYFLILAVKALKKYLNSDKK